MQHKIINDLMNRLDISNRNDNAFIEFLKDKVSMEQMTLANGYPALALFFSQLDRISPEQKFKKNVHFYLEKTIACIQNNNLVTNSSSFSGITGLAFVVWVSSENGKKYQKLIAKIDEVLFQLLDIKLSRLKTQKFFGPTDFDVIQGLSGIVRYLIMRKEDYTHAGYLKIIMDVLIRLSSYINYKNNKIPGWIFIKEMIGAYESIYEDSDECFNLGLSHGISGVLSALSLAKLNGINAEGVEESILNIKNWLVKAQQRDIYGIYWPNRLSLEEELTGIRNEQFDKYHRQAWCYGTPGVSRALYLAGQGLKDHKLQNFALKNFLEIEQRPEETWRSNSPTFCHGYAGLLQITKRFYFDTKEAKLIPLISRLEQRVMSYYTQEAPFLFKENNGFLIDIGIIEGTVGTVLSLLHTDHFADCIWDYPFLIS